MIKTQVTVQQSKTKKNEQKAKEIRSSITVLASQAQKNITMIKGYSVGLSKKILANASSEAAQMVINATTMAYKTLDTTTGFNPSNGLDEFIYYSNLQTAENVDVLYNVDKAVVKLR